MDLLWQWAHRLQKVMGFRFVGRLFEWLSFAVFSHAVSAGASIGSGTEFAHHAIGCVVHEHAVVGSDCKIFQHVTIGAKWGSGRDGVPIIGDYVQIGAGAVILGGVVVGDGAVIGANAVVVHDVPRECIAVGVPAKVIDRKAKSSD